MTEECGIDLSYEWLLTRALLSLQPRDRPSLDQYCAKNPSFSATSTTTTTTKTTTATTAPTTTTDASSSAYNSNNNISSTLSTSMMPRLNPTTSKSTQDSGATMQYVTWIQKTLPSGMRISQVL